MFLYIKPFGLFLKESSSHLLSHAVSSIVPSAAYVLTIVFGMRTGVSRKRIATGNFCVVLYSVRASNPLTLGNAYASPCARSFALWHGTGLIRQHDLPLGKSTVIQPLLLPLERR